MPFLRNLDLRVGIHTGKILGGIIGSKIVRYDVFGQDSLITRSILRNGQPGSVIVSEEFSLLLQNKQFICDTFDWVDQEKMKLETSDRVIQLIKVEQIFAMDGSSSEDLLDPSNNERINKEINDEKDEKKDEKENGMNVSEF